MSTPLRYIYRGNSTQYNLNYPLNNGFQQLPYDDQTGGCGIPVSCPTVIGSPLFLAPGNILVANPPCKYSRILWYRNNASESIGEGTNYTITENDIGSKVYFTVVYPDNSTDRSNENCYDTVLAPISKNWYRVYYEGNSLLDEDLFRVSQSVVTDEYSNTWSVKRYKNCESANIHKITTDAELVWSYEYRPDTSQNTLTDSGGNGRTILIEGSNNTLEIFYHRWSKTPTPYSHPSKIYRFTVDKDTGELYETKTITYTPIDTIVGTDVMISVIKKDDYYYLLQLRRVNTAPFAVIIHKFDVDLNLVWIKLLKGLERSASTDTCTATDTNYAQDFTEYNGLLIGCGGLASFNRATPSAFIIDLNGYLVKTLPYIRTVSGQRYTYVPRAVTVDDTISIYTVGGFESIPELVGLTYGRVLVLKQSYEGLLEWATDMYQTIDSVTPVSTGRANILWGKQLEIVQNKLVFVCLIEYSFTVPTTYVTFVSILNKEDGTIERAFMINSGPTTQLTRQGQYIKISKIKQPGGFIVSTAVGFRFTFDINNLPNEGTYNTDDPSKYVYTITDATLIQTSRISELESVTTGSCSTYPLVVPPISAYYGVNTTISGVAWLPSGTPIISGVSLVQN